MRLRKALLLAVVVSSLKLAGCTNIVSDQPTTSEQPTTATPTPTAPTTTQSTIASSDLSDSTAKDRALTAEETYLSAHLSNESCLNDWGTTPTTMDKEATIVNRTADGVVVDVTHPYWYSTGSSEADLGSNARYLVTENETTRLSGDDIDPC